MAAAGWFWWQGRQTQIPTSSPTPTTVPDPTADWRTYKDFIGGFSFKYPDYIYFEASPFKAEILQIEPNMIKLVFVSTEPTPTPLPNKPQIMDGGGSELSIRFITNALQSSTVQELAMKEFENVRTGAGDLPPEEIEINGIKGITYAVGGFPQYRDILLPHQSKRENYVRIMTAIDPIETIDQIISTFTFD